MPSTKYQSTPTSASYQMLASRQTQLYYRILQFSTTMPTHPYRHASMTFPCTTTIKTPTLTTHSVAPSTAIGPQSCARPSCSTITITTPRRTQILVQLNGNGSQLSGPNRGEVPRESPAAAAALQLVTVGHSHWMRHHRLSRHVECLPNWRWALPFQIWWMTTRCRQYCAAVPAPISPSVNATRERPPFDAWTTHYSSIRPNRPATIQATKASLPMMSGCIRYRHIIHSIAKVVDPKRQLIICRGAMWHDLVRCQPNRHHVHQNVVAAYLEMRRICRHRPAEVMSTSRRQWQQNRYSKSVARPMLSTRTVPRFRRLIWSKWLLLRPQTWYKTMHKIRLAAVRRCHIRNRASTRIRHRRKSRAPFFDTISSNR